MAFYQSIYIPAGFSGGVRGKEPACQCRRPKRLRFDPWVRKIPQRRPWEDGGRDWSDASTNQGMPETTRSQASQVALVVKSPPADAGDWETRVQSLGQEDPLEAGMATHSSIFAWRIPWTEAAGRLQSIGSQWVDHNWSNLARTHTTLVYSARLSSFDF